MEISSGVVFVGFGYILLIYAYWQYIKGIKNNTIPTANPASWFVFSAISFGNAIVLWGNISPMVQVFPVIMGLAQFLIARESHNKRQGYLESFDKLALLTGLAGVIFWVLSAIEIVSFGKIFPIVTLFVADAVGFFPTIRDAWRKPSREDIPVWGIFSFTGGLVLVGLYLSGEGGFNFLYPAYETALAVSTMLVHIFRSRSRGRSSSGGEWAGCLKGVFGLLFNYTKYAKYYSFTEIATVTSVLSALYISRS